MITVQVFRKIAPTHTYIAVQQHDYSCTNVISDFNGKKNFQWSTYCQNESHQVSVNTRYIPRT